MCYGLSTGTPGIPGGSPDRFLAALRARKARASLEGKRGAGDTAGFPADSGTFPCREAGGTSSGKADEVSGKESGADALGWGPMAEMSLDPKHDTAPPRECPRGGSKKKGSGGGQTAGGGGGGGSPDSGSSSSVSSPGSSGGTSSGAGAPGGGGRPPGKSPSKTPSGPVGTPKKRRRRSTRKDPAADAQAAAPAAEETAEDAAAALAALETPAPSTSTTSNILTTRQVRAAAAAARKKKREELKEKAEKEAAAAKQAAAAAAAASLPPPPAPPKKTAAAIAKEATASVSTSSAVAAAPPTQSAFPKYKCGPTCECNNLTREKLREKECTEGTEREHCRENLAFMRWVQLRRDNLEIKDMLRENNELLKSQNSLLQEVLGASKEAAIIRASEDLAADDKGELGMPWTDMDQSVAAFSTMPQRQMLYRILHRIVCKACHFPRMAMMEMFAPPLQQRVYPLAKPKSHKNRDSAWKYGYKYHILPKVTLDFIAFVLSKKYVGFTSDSAAKEVKDHLNDARETAKEEDKKKFYGKLDQPVYLLVWRDSEAKTYVIQETPPYDGDDEAKDAFIGRWETDVDEAIADKHPLGFIHKNPPHP